MQTEGGGCLKIATSLFIPTLQLIQFIERTPQKIIVKPIKEVQIAVVTLFEPSQPCLRRIKDKVTDKYKNKARSRDNNNPQENVDSK